MRRRATVLHVIPGLGLGGAETMLAKLVAPPADGPDDFLHHVVDLQGGGPLTQVLRRAGVPVTALHLPPGAPSGRGLARLARLVRAVRPQLLQGWMYHGNLAATLVAHAGWPLPKIPVVWSIHGADPKLSVDKIWSRAVAAAGAHLSPCAAAIVYVSRRGAAAHAHAGFATAQALCIPIGFDPDVFRPLAAAPQQLRAALGIARESLLVGLVARFHPVKDHGTFFAAAALLADFARQHDLHFVLVGPRVTPDEPALAALLQTHPLAHRMHLLGPRTDIATILPGLDVCTLTSRSEAFPNILGEAMACGVRCVATDVGDCAVLMGNTGRLVGAAQPAALAAAWQETLSAPDKTARGLAARAHVLEHFHIDTMRARFRALYWRHTPAGAPT